MSTINKLSIQGIRSFSPDDPQVIAFRKPLTLIVGSNGAGKTTIIECIKMALTGELPPDANRGKNFIHDPKVDTSSETKAAIKLEFRTVNKKKCTVARQFTLAYKTRRNDAVPSYSMCSSSLECYNDDTGRKDTISHKCVDIDKAIPQHMGISKAILENVIFVHQEDANWPLRESKVLKQKFDDIFAATRYSKALETIKKLRKEKTDLVKDEKIALAEKKSRVEKRQDILNRMQRQRNTIEETERDLQDHDKHLAEYQTELNRMKAVREQYETLGSQIDGFKAARAEMIKTREQLKETIDQNGEGYLEDDSDDKLHKWRDQLMRKTDDNSSLILSKQDEIELKQTEMEAKDKHIASKERELFSLEHGREENSRRIRDCDVKIAKLAENLDVSLSGRGQQDLLHKCTCVLREQEEELRKIKEKHRMNLDNCRREISATEGKLEQDRSKLLELEDEAKQNEQVLASLLRKLQQNAHDVLTDHDLQALKSQISDFQRNKAKIEKQVETNQKLIDEKQQSKRTIESKYVALEQQLNELKTQQQQLAKVASLSTQYQSEKERIALKLNEVSTNAMELDPSVDCTHLEEFVLHTAAAAERDVNDSKTKLVSTQARREHLEQTLQTETGKMNQLENKAQVIQKNLAKARRTVRENSDATWEELVAGRQARVDELTRKMNLLEVAGDAYKEILHRAEHFSSLLQMDAPCQGCPVCKRSFKNAEEFDSYKRDLQDIIDESCNTAGGETAQQLKNCQKMLEFTSGKLAKFNELQKLESETANVQQAITSIHSEIEGLRQDECNEAQQLENAQIFCKKVHGLQTMWKDYSHQNDHLLVLERKVSEETSCLHGVAEIQDLDSIQSTYEAERRNHDSTAKEIFDLFEERDRMQKQLSQLSTNIDKWNNRIHDAERNQDAREIDIERKDKLQKDIPVLRNRITHLHQEIANTEASLAQKTETETVLRAQCVSEEDKLDRRLSVHKTALSEIESLQTNINSYCREHPDDERQKLMLHINMKKEEQEQLKRQIVDLTDECRKLKQAVQDKEIVLRHIKDVINYRDKEQEIGKISSEIRMKTEERAHVAPDHNWTSTVRKLEEKVEKGVGGRGQLEGKKSQCQQELRTLEAALTNYDGADKDYRNTLITVKTLELGCADLDKYYQALDKALVSYHAEKMREVNEIAKHLWEQTYKGQDIERIEIRADEAGRKSYNYRLLMRKGSAELDMRGRCSAGQKVLASLIIRLALAETFCLNCGILALDEPTTNLDTENIKSLCIALQEIIEQRKSQEGFQLIVITHDEDFMTELSRSAGGTDTYYRVSKDDRSHSSLIQEQDISEY